MHRVSLCSNRSQRCRLLAAGSALCLAVAAVHADTPGAAGAAVTEVLRRQTQELFDAIAAGDAGVWERYLHEDVRYIDEGGDVSTKKEMLAGLKPLPEGVSGKIQVTAYDVALHGDVAVATHVEVEDENYHGHQLHCRYRTTDTWLRSKQGWRLIAAQVTRASGDSLWGQQSGRKQETLRAEAPDVLFVPGRPRYRYLMQRGADGKVSALIQRREAWDLVWKRVK